MARIALQYEKLSLQHNEHSCPERQVSNLACTLNTIRSTAAVGCCHQNIIQVYDYAVQDTPAVGLCTDLRRAADSLPSP